MGEAQGGGGGDGAREGLGRRPRQGHKPEKERTHSGPRRWMEPCCGVNAPLSSFNPACRGGRHAA